MNWNTNIRKVANLVALVLTLAVSSPLPAHAGINRWTNRGLDGRAIQSLAVDPSNPSRIYAAAGPDGLFRTDDGGMNWIGLTAGTGGVVGKVAMDAQAPDTLYAISGVFWNARIFKTTDGGNTWTPADSRYPVYSVIVDPNREGLVYTGHSAEVSVSRDGAATWSSSEIPYYCSFICSAALTSLALDPASPSTIYAGVDADYDYPGTDQLFKSTDAGSTWSISDRGLEIWSSVYALAVDPGDSSRVFAGTSSGIYLSRDAGRTWSQSSPWVIRALVFDPRNSSVVYAGTDRDGVLRSTDRGLTWSSWNRGLPNLQVLSLTIESTGRLLHAGTRDGVFAYQIADTLEVFGGADGATGFFRFDTPSGRLLLGTVEASGRTVPGSSYGPYSGWTAGNGASGPDGVTRVLWNNDDGSAALWLARPEGVAGSFLYRSRPGWSAVDVAAGFEDSTHILWTNTAGAMALWTVDGSGVRTHSFDSGPYSGWSAVAIADGADGRSRVLWNKTDGAAGLTLFDSSGMLDTYRFGLVPGFRAVDLAIGEDNQARILWTHADGRMALWTIDRDGQPASLGTIYSSPAGFRAARLSAGSDGLTRVLWTDPNGSAIVWLMSSDGAYQGSFSLN